MIQSITDENFIQETSQGIVLVEFWTQWCSYCKMLEPILEELDREYALDIQIRKMNVETNEVISEQYNVMSLPLLILFKDGEAKEKIVGYYPKHILKNYFKEILQK